MKAIELPAAADIELDAFLEPFEAAALRGEEPDLSSFLPNEHHPKYLLVLRELIRLDLEFAWERGECPRLESYVKRFPALARDRESLLEVAREEFRQREAAGESPDSSEYARRFGIELSTSGGGPPGLPDSTKQNWSSASTNWSGEAMPEPGDVIPPGFIVRRELGRGAFGRVYLAEQADLASRLVAIKISTRLIGEAQTLARLQHTNIVPIYSVHRVGDHQVLVMPYLGAATLADLLSSIRSSGSIPTTVRGIQTVLSHKRGVDRDAPANLVPLAESAARPLVRDADDQSYVRAVLTIGMSLADGLAHAHARGILHRDLKPANVLLADDGRPMLLDFNLAADPNEESQSVGGTPRYMAPEHLASLIDGKTPIDGRADVYSLGLMLHELLTGRIPFPERTGGWQNVAEATRRDRLTQPAIAIESPAISAILRKCIEPLPENRYRSAENLREDLARHLADSPLRFAREPLSRERLQKWSRRHPRLTSATSIATLACLVLGIVAWLGYSAWQRAAVASARESRSLVLETREQVQPMVVDPHGPGAQFSEARYKVQKSLAPYDLSAGDWSDQRSIRRLPPDERAQLRRVIAEVLTYDAEAAGRLAEKEGDPIARSQLIEEAIASNERAEAAFPDRSPIRPIIAQRAWLLRLSGRHREADETASELPQTVVPGGDSYFDAIEALREKRYREAANLLEPLTQTGRGSFSVWMMLGTAYLRTGQFDAAGDAFLSASALEPEKHWPRFYRGVALLSAGKLDAARGQFDRVVSIQPNIPEAWLNRAIARFRLDDLDGAIGDLFQAEKLNGSKTRILDLRERILRRQAKHADADIAYAELLRVTPTDVESWTVRGEARLRHSPTDAKGALGDFAAALKLEPNHLPALKGRASCLAEHLTQPQEAVDVVRRLLELSPHSIDDRAGYAVLLARLGHKDDARTQARQCVTRESSALVLYQAASALVLVAETKANTTEAIEILRRALRIDPSWSSVMPADPDLKRVHDEPAFQSIVAAARVLHGRTGRAN